MKYICIFSFTFLSAFSALGQISPDFDNSASTAWKRYEAAIQRAQSTYASELEAAKLHAMKNGDLEKANKIEAEIKKLKANKKSFKTEGLGSELRELINSHSWTKADSAYHFSKEMGFLDAKGKQTGRWYTVNENWIVVIRDNGSVFTVRFPDLKVAKGYVPHHKNPLLGTPK